MIEYGANFWDYKIDIPFLIFKRGTQKRDNKKAHTKLITSVGQVNKSLIHCIYHHHHQKGMLIVLSVQAEANIKCTHTVRFNWNYANETWTGKRDNSNKNTRNHGKRDRNSPLDSMISKQWKKSPTKRSKKAEYLLKKWKTSSVK